MDKKPITVTQPYLPPLEEFTPFLEEIWNSKWLTNNGQFHQRFEQELCSFLGVNHLALVANATIGLVTALQTLRVSGEVITTPYSFVATTHSLFWNRIQPVFVDIDPLTMNLDPEKIEAAITPKTAAIMPVHCYGFRCDTEEIQRIADAYGLKVIYDAAHAFNVRHGDQSILAAGDLSILSFHATKVFNTFEGGAIVCPDAKTKQRVDYLKNFGIADEVTVVAPGINGKMNEFQSALGILQLKHVNESITMRSIVDAYYRQELASVSGISFPEIPHNSVHNYAYFPVLVRPNYPVSRDALYERLRESNIFARRYFYPLISNLPMYRGHSSATRANLPIANEIASQILCLPIYPELSKDDLKQIVGVVRNP